MAMAVEFRQFTPENSRNDLLRRLEKAPQQHAEAILSAAYELLQRMHDKGLIDIANGLLSASETVVERAADVISSKQAITALRLVLIFSNLLDSVDPDRVAAVLSAPKNKPYTLWTEIKKAVSGYFRLVLVTAVDLFRVFGSSVRSRKPA
jgi:uncharacterized protein YjgD (DUF1641 family)